MKSIENVQGTDLDDWFRDDGADNRFEGRDGDDTFIFTGGYDRGEGGSGADTFIYRGTDFGDNEILDFEDGTDLIQIEELVAYGEMTISDVNGDKLIEWAGNSIRLEGLAGATIDENDFILPPI